MPTVKIKMQRHLEDAKGFYRGALQDNLGIDDDVHNVPAMHIGVIFVDRIIKELDGNTQKFGDMLRNVDEYNNISSWLGSHGLDPHEIEKKLKEDIRYEDKAEESTGWGNRFLKKIRGK